MNELIIQIYKVDEFEHHVPKSIEEDFVAEVKKAKKHSQPIDDPYQTSSEEHQEACDSPVIDNKIFHFPDKVWSEAIEDVDVLIYELPQAERDDFIFYCPLDLGDALEHQIAFHNQQSKEGEGYSTTIREYQERSKNPQANECFISIDANFQNYDPLASLFSKELTKRNIKKIEDIDMTTDTATNPAKTIENSLPESLNIEASIDQSINQINNQFRILVEQELNKVSEEATTLNNLGNDLEECDLDNILVVNNQWTTNMSLEDKQSQVVEIIKQLDKDSLEYKMAYARRIQLTKTKLIKSLKSKLTKKTNVTVKNKIQSETKAFESNQSEAFKQDRYTSEEAINDIAEAKANRMFNKIEAKRQKQRDHVFDVLTVGVTSAVVDNCYPEFETAIKQHAATVSKLSSMLVEKAQVIDKKDPVQVKEDYDQIVRQVVKSVKEEGMPSIKPRTALDFQTEKETETVSQSVT